MIANFKTELAKLLALIAVILVVIGGLAAKLPLQTLFIRLVIGGGIFAGLGFLLGSVIDQQRQMLLIKSEKQKYKAKARANYDKAVNEMAAKNDAGFAPLEVDKLTRIIVDTIHED